MNVLALSAHGSGESALRPEPVRRIRARLRLLPLIAVIILLLLPPAAALAGRDTLIWSENLTLNENSEGYYEFSNFFVLESDRIVWMNIWSERKYENPLCTDTLYLMNITEGTTRAIARAPDATHPWSLFPPFTLSRDLVAYTDLGNGNLFLFNISEGRELTLTRDGSLDSLDEARENHDPSMDGDRIVWAKKKPYTKGYDYDIVMQNLTTGEFTGICTATGDQVDPRISGTRIVWTDRRDESGSDGGDIYLFDLATGNESRVCTAPGLQQQADISGDTVVWSDYRDGNPAIYVYNLTTNRETRISDPLSHAYRPLIDGDIVAWSEYFSLDRSDDPPRRIMLYDLRTGTRERLDIPEPTYGLEDLNEGRVLYSTSGGNATREGGYLHLFIIDTPRTGAPPVTAGVSPAPGRRNSSPADPPQSAGSPAGSLDPFSLFRDLLQGSFRLP